MSKTLVKEYDLEKRTLKFAKDVIHLCKKIPKTITNTELVKQLVKSGTSVGANYREANESLGKKDLVFRLKIARKEAKESTYWLELIVEANPAFNDTIKPLLQESKELRNILTSIINKLV